MAVSDDLKGLNVHGRSEEEIAERVPVAIRALLEASGKFVIEVSETYPPMPGFVANTKTFDARIGSDTERVSA
jgi:hypothetical protein